MAQERREDSTTDLSDERLMELAFTDFKCSAAIQKANATEGILLTDENSDSFLPDLLQVINAKKGEKYDGIGAAATKALSSQLDPILAAKAIQTGIKAKSIMKGVAALRAVKDTKTLINFMNIPGKETKHYDIVSEIVGDAAGMVLSAKLPAEELQHREAQKKAHPGKKGEKARIEHPGAYKVAYTQVLASMLGIVKITCKSTPTTTEPTFQIMELLKDSDANIDAEVRTRLKRAVETIKKIDQKLNPRPPSLETTVAEVAATARPASISGKPATPSEPANLATLKQKLATINIAIRSLEAQKQDATGLQARRIGAYIKAKKGLEEKISATAIQKIGREFLGRKKLKEQHEQEKTAVAPETNKTPAASNIQIMINKLLSILGFTQPQEPGQKAETAPGKQTMFAKFVANVKSMFGLESSKSSPAEEIIYKGHPKNSQSIEPSETTAPTQASAERPMERQHDKTQDNTNTRTPGM
jgi:hypothetical protein